MQNKNYISCQTQTKDGNDHFTFSWLFFFGFCFFFTSFAGLTTFLHNFIKNKKKKKFFLPHRSQEYVKSQNRRGGGKHFKLMKKKKHFSIFLVTLNFRNNRH